MTNQIILDSANTGTFIGPLAGRYASHPELRLRVDELFQAAQRSTNRHFVLNGVTCLAAQSTLEGALNYMERESDVLVSIELPDAEA